MHWGLAAAIAAALRSAGRRAHRRDHRDLLARRVLRPGRNARGGCGTRSGVFMGLNFSLFAIVILSFSLAGCGIAQQREMQARAEALQAQSAAAAQNCETTFPAGNPKTAVARAKCQTEALAILRPTIRYPDLTDVWIATRLSSAEDVQNGRMSIAKANELMAAKTAELTAEEQRRNLANRSVAAQEGVAAASWRAAGPRSCTRIGDTVNCF
jgi:hypothetical protein